MRGKLSLAYDTILSEEDLLCKWFDPKKGFGLFVGKSTAREMLIHRECVALPRRERCRLRKGFTVKVAEWQVL